MISDNMLNMLTDIVRRLERLERLESPAKTYTDWTPTVTQSGSVAVTVNEAKYSLVGKVCHIYAKLTVTGSGTITNAIVIGGLPVDSADTNVDSCKGSFMLKDIAAAYYVGSLVIASASTCKLLTDGSGDYVGITPNFALASGDLISLSATYRVA
jgi:hypothetical protein